MSRMFSDRLSSHPLNLARAAHLPPLNMANCVLFRGAGERIMVFAGVVLAVPLPC